MWKIFSIFVAATLGITAFILVPFQTPLLSIGAGIMTAFVAYAVIQAILIRIIDKDTIYIRDSLREARKKNKQIQVYGRKLRLWKLWRKIRYIRKVNTEIIMTIQAHPNRFQQADKFFSLYLDSTMNVLEKYDVLVHQPVRSHGLQKSLQKTEHMLDDVVRGLEQQLAYVLHDDIIELEIEKEVLDKHDPNNKEIK